MAAHWDGIQFEDFIGLEGEEQSRIVAAYETAMQMEAVMAEEAQREARRKQPTRRHRGN